VTRSSPSPSETFNIAEQFISRPAREHPDKPAILGVEREATYAQLEKEVNRVARALLDSGCKPGDRVLIALPDSIDFIACFFAAAKIGAIAVPVNSMARATDYRHYLSNSGARFAMAHASILPEFASGIVGGALELVVVFGHTVSRLQNPACRIVHSIRWFPVSGETAETYPTAATGAAFFLYTSGSGGPPKAAVHRHRDMLVTSRNFAQGVLALRADDRMFSVSKLYFAYGLGNGMYFPFFFGASTVLYPDRPRPDRIAQLVAQYRPTVFFAVPTFYAALLRDAEQGLNVDFSSIRIAVSAGESLPAEIFERFRERFGIEILDGIGSTEMLHVFLSARPGQARPGTCGREVPGYEARIIDEARAPVPDGEIGNLWVKGDSAFAEYWQIPELTARVKQDGWVFTGDKFTRDAEGFYRYRRPRRRHDESVRHVGLARGSGECAAVASSSCGMRRCWTGGRAGVGAARCVHRVAHRINESRGRPRQRNKRLAAHPPGRLQMSARIPLRLRAAENRHRQSPAFSSCALLNDS
jgi:acyl-coenzyme A synthetase/AMP-(fatty) acid ligase